MLQLAEISQAVAVVAACWAIVSGIGAWKREFIGKRRIELAEQLLAKFFQVKDDIAFIRSPFGRVEEGKSREHEAGETADESALLDRGYVVIERYDKRQATFVDFNTLKYRCMATFGSETESIFVDTNRALNSIFASAQMLAHHYWKRQGRVQMQPDEFKRHLDEMHQHEGIFWDSSTEEDVIRTQLHQIQRRLEQVTAPCFKEPMTLYSLLTGD